MTRVTTLFLLIGLICLVACTPVAVQSSEPRNLTPSATWSGDYPIAALDQLPSGQQQNRAGYIGDVDTFARIWQNFMPEAALPAVDFENNLVVFHRNVFYYNRTNILKVTLTEGVAEVLAMETMSAMPVEDRAAMAMAVIPRAGVKAIRLDESTTVEID
ncbi:MAG: hypothetical protein JRE01_06715 [Deltaproteobacteria bacterium]|jgi:hypothetical protein|nr:hypothetical protein [Deltaproteobacteria bacterium]